MEELFPNGWQHYLVGGLLVGLGTGLTFLLTGIRAGASGFFTTTLSYFSRQPALRLTSVLSQRGWRAAFTVGTLLGAVVFTAVFADGRFVTGVQWWRLALGGVLVGFGTRLSRGCTSGHGVCGVPAGSKSSIVAVVVFMGVAIAVARAMLALGVTP